MNKLQELSFYAFGFGQYKISEFERNFAVELYRKALYKHQIETLKSGGRDWWHELA